MKIVLILFILLWLFRKRIGPRSNMFAVLWFFCVLLPVILGGLRITALILFNIVEMLKSGFWTIHGGLGLCAIIGMVFAFTGLIPTLRKCYYKLPWLYPLSMMMTMDILILAIAEEILAIGFSVISSPRHLITTIIMIIQITVCRMLMCVYLKKHPLFFQKYDQVE